MTDRTPRTEAGRRMLADLPYGDSGYAVYAAQIRAIEDECLQRVDDMNAAIEARAAGPREAPPCRRCGYDAAAYRALATEGEPQRPQFPTATTLTVDEVEVAPVTRALAAEPGNADDPHRWDMCGDWGTDGCPHGTRDAGTERDRDWRCPRCGFLVDTPMHTEGCRS